MAKQALSHSAISFLANIMLLRVTPDTVEFEDCPGSVEDFLVVFPTGTHFFAKALGACGIWFEVKDVNLAGERQNRVQCPVATKCHPGSQRIAAGC